jgi:hypothetical protein
MEETWTRMETSDGQAIHDSNGNVITPLSSPPAPTTPTSDGTRLVTAHEQLLRNTTGYYRRMWDDQTF